MLTTRPTANPSTTPRPSTRPCSEPDRRGDRAPWHAERAEQRERAASLLGRQRGTLTPKPTAAKSIPATSAIRSALWKPRASGGVPAARRVPRTGRRPRSPARLGARRRPGPAGAVGSGTRSHHWLGSARCPAASRRCSDREVDDQALARGDGRELLHGSDDPHRDRDAADRGVDRVPDGGVAGPQQPVGRDRRQVRRSGRLAGARTGVLGEAPRGRAVAARLGATSEPRATSVVVEPEPDPVSTRSRAPASPR